MMKRDWDLLFSRYDLRAGFENQLNQVEDKVWAVNPVRFETSTDDLLSATIASELVIAPIELHEDQLSVSPRDAKVDVSYDRNRAFFSPGPHYVDGLEVTARLHTTFPSLATRISSKASQTGTPTIHLARSFGQAS